MVFLFYAGRTVFIRRGRESMDQVREKYAMRVERLEQVARELRKRIVTMVYQAQSGHPGGSLSAADIVTALYFDIMRVDPEKPKDPNRDRFIMSKGHACPAWYASLAMKGYFDEEHLKTLRRFGSILQGHPDMKKTPGLDMSTGSLGQGAAASVGMALDGKQRKNDYHVYTILGDGELDEGIVWESLLVANKYKLDNLTYIIDYNKLQLDGTIEQVMPLEPLIDKFKAFGWHVITIDGHDMKVILQAFETAKEVKGRPTVIIAHTIKGKGVSFMENDKNWHGQAPNTLQYEQAMVELEGARNE